MKTLIWKSDRWWVHWKKHPDDNCVWVRRLPRWQSWLLSRMLNPYRYYEKQTEPLRAEEIMTF